MRFQLFFLEFRLQDQKYWEKVEPVTGELFFKSILKGKTIERKTYFRGWILDLKNQFRCPKTLIHSLIFI